MNRLSRSRLLLAGAIWVGILIVEVFNWGGGGTKAIALLLLLAGTCALTVAAQPGASADSGIGSRPLLVACSLLLAVHLGFLATQIAHPRLLDVATTTLAAGRALLVGGNPYALPLDGEALRVTGDPAFQGYKYLPMMAVTYLPLGAWLGPRGVLVTNLALQLATIGLIYRLGWRDGSRNAGLVAVLFYLSLPIALRQVFGKGATDLAAVVPLLAALLTMERRPALSGFFVGLSISAKLLPGVLLLPCALPPAGRRCPYLIGVMVGLVPALVFVAMSPVDLYDNIVLFNTVRMPDSTSWLADAPAVAPSLARAVFVASLAAACLFVWRKAPSLPSRCGLLAGLTILAILSGPAAHHNYHLWWLPLVSVLVGLMMVQGTPLPRPFGLNSAAMRVDRLHP
ncbi:MAG TPA: glycosyltransferase 87 family protein [Stellaceae bacterium]|nr:glycosyltransferase 87 family protein [Stellaceae bacterium]